MFTEFSHYLNNYNQQDKIVREFAGDDCYESLENKNSGLITSPLNRQRPFKKMSSEERMLNK